MAEGDTVALHLKDHGFWHSTFVHSIHILQVYK